MEAEGECRTTSDEQWEDEEAEDDDELGGGAGIGRRGEGGVYEEAGARGEDVFAPRVTPSHGRSDTALATASASRSPPPRRTPQAVLTDTAPNPATAPSRQWKPQVATMPRLPRNCWCYRWRHRWRHPHHHRGRCPTGLRRGTPARCPTSLRRSTNHPRARRAPASAPTRRPSPSPTLPAEPLRPQRRATEARERRPARAHLPGHPVDPLPRIPFQYRGRRRRSSLQCVSCTCQDRLTCPSPPMAGQAGQGQFRKWQPPLCSS